MISILMNNYIVIILMIVLIFFFSGDSDFIGKIIGNKLLIGLILLYFAINNINLALLLIGLIIIVMSNDGTRQIIYQKWKPKLRQYQKLGKLLFEDEALDELDQLDELDELDLPQDVDLVSLDEEDEEEKLSTSIV